MLTEAYSIYTQSNHCAKRPLEMKLYQLQQPTNQIIQRN